MPIIIFLAAALVLSLSLAIFAYKNAQNKQFSKFESWAWAAIGFFVIPAMFMIFSLYKRFSGNFGMFGIGGLELLVLIVSTVAAILGYRLAKRRNREAALWAVLCFLLPVLVIVLLCLGVFPKHQD